MKAFLSRLLLLLLLTGTTGCAGIQRGYEAALVLADLTTEEDPSRLQRTTPAPAVSEIRYRVAGRDYLADLYQPGEPPLAALVLVHGIAEKGKDDPRLQAFAETLARVRFTVLVPDIENFRTLDLNSEDAQDIADAVTFLSGKPGLAPGGHTGIGAFSYAVGPAILAALKPDVGRRVSFILGVGGYYDLVKAITYVTTGYYQAKGKTHHRKPNPQAKWAVLQIYLDRIDDAEDREILASIAERKLENPDAEVERLVAGLGPQGQAVYQLVTNRDPERVPALVIRLPPDVAAEIRALDLTNKDLSRLHAQLILVHGRDDEVIPYSHSVALAEALPPEQAQLFLVGGLFHVDINPSLGDVWKLWQAAMALLAMREE